MLLEIKILLIYNTNAISSLVDENVLLIVSSLPFAVNEYCGLLKVCNEDKSMIDEIVPLYRLTKITLVPTPWNKPHNIHEPCWYLNVSVCGEPEFTLIFCLLLFTILPSQQAHRFYFQLH